MEFTLNLLTSAWNSAWHMIGTQGMLNDWVNEWINSHVLSSYSVIWPYYWDRNPYDENCTQIPLRLPQSQKEKLRNLHKQGAGNFSVLVDTVPLAVWS